MSRYKRLSLEEREKIYLLQRKNVKSAEMAKILNRHKSTISRELQRFKGEELGYLPDKAHLQYKSKLSRNKERFLCDKLQALVIEKLTKNRWSPEQISGRLKQENASIYVSTETVYKFIYSPKGIKLHLPTFLKQRRKKRGFRKSRKVGTSRIIDLVAISERPKKVENRKEFGHWEGDLVIFGTTRPSNISCLVERKTRFTKIIANRSKRTNEVMPKIKDSFDSQNYMIKSITFDRGMEFASHKILETNAYFCNPGSPWQKGSVENMNGRIRQLMPTSKTPLLIKQEHVDYIAFLLNNTPRKILGYKTPQELMDANLKLLYSSRCASS
jgi:IS30 family transposase